MSAPSLLFGYRLALAAILLLASLLTLIGPEHDAMVLAGIEIVGALLFAWHRSQYVGAAVLLGVFAFAEYMSIRHGRFPTYFLQYAVAVVFVIAMDRRFVRPV